MDNKIELFYGALRFSPFWGTVYLLLVLHFFWAWFRSSKRTGWKIDFWWLTLFLQFFLFIVLPYPFAASIFNVPATLHNYARIEPFVDLAFTISVAGYLALWLGRALYDLSARKLVFIPFSRFFRFFEEAITHNISSKLCMRGLVFLTIFCFVLLAPTIVSEGAIFSARNFFLQDDAMRPLFNLTLCMFSMTIWYLAVRYLEWREKTQLYLLILLLILCAFLGSRGSVVGGLILLFSLHVYSKKGRVSLWKCSALVLTLLSLALFLECLRQGLRDPLFSMLYKTAELLYGNQFSDTRDFAWVLSYWDGDFQYGKTYIAALFSFLPRIFASFREAWSYGAYSVTLVGMDPSFHAGLRPGPFGEIYLNFGILGVFFLGTLTGYIMRRCDVRLKEVIVREGSLIRAYTATFPYFFLANFLNTAGFWLLYFFLFTNLFFYLLGSRLSPRRY